MEYKLIGITGLILIILFLTWLKDGEKMDPSLKKRVIIDTTTIMIFWGVFEFYNYSSDKLYEEEVSVLVNGALIFFFARMIQLIAQINPLFQDFVKFIKKKGIDLDNEDK
ncbi:holin [Lactococcus piscium]|uniref:Holin n=1 Tax=Pseudolactococcus paracarnosus TaxID=2749962 RepID=A0A7L4WDE2_9LACT|nr:holin [Lactococcus paracarnosus]MCJ1994953.1 holin [Lactococcus paracarnosus]QDJ28207.1 holin [Lactococcus paracarnosus]SPC35391.1 Holin [Lactococcus piscium]